MERAITRMSGEGPTRALPAPADPQPPPADPPPLPADPAPTERTQGSAPSLAPSVPAHVKDISLEGLWAGLRLKKDLTLGNVSQPGWKSSKPVVTKVRSNSLSIYIYLL